MSESIIPEEIKFQRLIDIPDKPTPEILLEKMGKAAYELENANRFIQSNFRYMKSRVEKARTIILSRKFELLTNKKLAAHLKSIYEQNEKYKATKEDLENFIYLECQNVLEAFEDAQLTAKQAIQEHDGWSRQLSWYQSQLKHESMELSVMGRKT